MITVKNVDYRCIIHNISKYEAINLLSNSILVDVIVGIYKRIFLVSGLFKTVFLLYLFSVYKMVDIMNIYNKSLNISIGTVMKSLEMLKFAPDHLKTKKMCKHAVNQLLYILRYIPDQYKTRKMFDKAILENGETLKPVSDCHKKQEMCNKAVDNYPHALEFVPECYKTRKKV